jgi:hypothetical protein
MDKDLRRDTLLRENDYQELKIELKRRGLRISGDKLEMITRLLLHIVDPSINFNEMYTSFSIPSLLQPFQLHLNFAHAHPTIHKDGPRTESDIHYEGGCGYW